MSSGKWRPFCLGSMWLGWWRGCGAVGMEYDDAIRLLNKRLSHATRQNQMFWTLNSMPDNGSDNGLTLIRRYLNQWSYSLLTHIWTLGLDRLKKSISWMIAFAKTKVLTPYNKVIKIPRQLYFKQRVKITVSGQENWTLQCLDVYVINESCDAIK